MNLERIIRIPVELKRYTNVLEDGLRSLSLDPQWIPFSLVEKSCYTRVVLTPKAEEYLEKIKKNRRSKGVEDEQILQTALMYARKDRVRPVERYCPFIG